MSNLLEQIGNVVMNSLSLEGEKIGEEDYDTPLNELATREDLGIDEVDIADIMYRLGIPFQEYFDAAAGGLTGRGILRLNAISNYHSGSWRDLEEGAVDLLADIRNLKELPEKISVRCLGAIKEYVDRERLYKTA